MPIRAGSYGYLKGRELSTIKTIPDFSATLASIPVFANSINLVNPKWISPAYDQKRSSSCVANMGSSLSEYGLKRTPGMPQFTPSRLFAYYNARAIEGDTDQDAGCFVHDYFHQARFVGLISEELYPFSDDPATIIAKPPDSCYEEAKKIQPGNFAWVDNADINKMKLCLNHGFPFGIGFRVPIIFESPAFSSKPILHLPGPFARFVGGHGVSVWGYDDNKALFLIRNSWGVDWGEDGYFWMDYEFMLSNLVSDAHMIRFPGQDQSLSIAA